MTVLRKLILALLTIGTATLTLTTGTASALAPLHTWTGVQDMTQKNDSTRITCTGAYVNDYRVKVVTASARTVVTLRVNSPVYGSASNVCTKVRSFGQISNAPGWWVSGNAAALSYLRNGGITSGSDVNAVCWKRGASVGADTAWVHVLWRLFTGGPVVINDVPDYAIVQDVTKIGLPVC